MSKRKTITPLSLAAGAAIAASLGSAPAVHADVNPFSVTMLSSGYMVAEKGAEGQCGGNKRVSEAECGANKASTKVKEGECGAAKTKPVSKPIQEAKCGEAKCGGNK